MVASNFLSTLLVNQNKKLDVLNLKFEAVEGVEGEREKENDKFQFQAEIEIEIRR